MPPGSRPDPVLLTTLASSLVRPQRRTRLSVPAARHRTHAQVFVGEENNEGKITGLHNWVQYFIEEKKGNIN